MKYEYEEGIEKLNEMFGEDGWYFENGLIGHRPENCAAIIVNDGEFFPVVGQYYEYDDTLDIVPEETGDEEKIEEALAELRDARLQELVNELRMRFGAKSRGIAPWAKVSSDELLDSTIQSWKSRNGIWDTILEKNFGVHLGLPNDDYGPEDHFTIQGRYEFVGRAWVVECEGPYDNGAGDKYLKVFIEEEVEE